MPGGRPEQAGDGSFRPISLIVVATGPGDEQSSDRPHQARQTMPTGLVRVLAAMVREALAYEQLDGRETRQWYDDVAGNG